ncbi:MAG: hypothetical protein QM756_40570 [Polyangiaceae bacterium]
MSQAVPTEHSPFSRAYAVLLPVVFAITFLKGFRLPSSWCATHFAFNYSQGFVRRGLVGEIARQLFGDDVFKYRNFVFLAYSMWLVVGALLGLLIVRALRSAPKDWGLKCALLVFAASPALLFFVHAVGYFDYIGVALVIGFGLLAPRIRPSFALPPIVLALGTLLLFIHEGLIVMFGPTLVFVVVCHVARAAREKPLPKWAWVVLGAEVVLCTLPLLCIAVWLSTTGMGDAPRVQALSEFMARHADFGIRGDAVETLTRSSAVNFKQIVPWYWAQPTSREYAARDLSSILPGMALVATYGCLAIRRLALGRWLGWLVLVAFVLAMFSAELMNFVGWDWPRWNGVALVNGVVCILLVKLALPTDVANESGARFVMPAAVCTAIALASTSFLFDDYKVQYYPFDSQFELMHQMFKSDFKLHPRN